MEATDMAGSPTTYFAPAERAGAPVLATARAAFRQDRMAVALLEAIPDLAMVLNAQRQIIAVNQRLLQAFGVEDAAALVGLRPGEAADCVHAADGPGGCGTGVSCTYCGAVNAILDCLSNRRAAARECRIATHGQQDGGALELDVQATFLVIGEHDLAVIAMRDISAEKRRRLLERVFFHDILNTAGGIRAIAELMQDPEEPAELIEEYKQDLSLLSEQIVEEIRSQRQLLAAERGELALDLSEVPVPAALAELQAFYRHHHLARDITLALGRCPEEALTTDLTLLRRILGNLVKNALEATGPGGTVTLSAERCGDRVAFHVHNPAVMPEEVQRQIFLRSFSTKGGPGRGIGTYSVKLFTERYLHGEVRFVSREPDGTTFTIALPVAIEA